MQVDIKTLKQALQQVEANTREAAAAALNDVAGLVQAEARAQAPQGPTGNLKKAIEVKVEANRKQRRLMALVKVNRKIAPHAWLVEHGTKGQPRKFKGGKKKSSREAYQLPDGSFIHKKSGEQGPEVGPMPANYYFRKGVAKGKKQFVQKVKARVNAKAMAYGV